MDRTIVIDIGGTNTRVALMDKTLSKLDHIYFPTDTENPKITFEKICEFINKHETVTRVGMSLPGFTDYENGIAGPAFNLNWKGFKMYDYIKKNTKVEKIRCANDANLMALANHFYFNKTKDDITQFYTISTGLGGGLIINNKLFEGSTGFAQEIAGMPIAWENIKDKNNMSGSFESFAAGAGIISKGKEFRFRNTKEIMEAYNTNEDAKKILDEGIETLANGIACSLSLLNPSFVVFGGSVARHNKWYVEKAIELAKTRAFPTQYENVHFAVSELADDAALMGAYYMMNK